MAKLTIRRLLLASVGVSVLAITSASAADIAPSRSYPLPKSPVFVPFFSWTGFYIGLNAGYGFGSSEWTNTTAGVSTGSFDVNGAMVGGTIGYNWQYASAVFGLEGDI
jgi:outer membrane immunogenic protein